jgi:alpha-glucosidase
LQHTGEKPVDTLALHLYPGNGSSELYEDDGHTWAFQEGNYRLTRFRMTTEWTGDTSQPAQIRVESTSQGRFVPEYQHMRVVLHGLPAIPQEILVDGKAVYAHSAESGTHPCPAFYAPSHPPLVFVIGAFETIQIHTL